MDHAVRSNCVRSKTIVFSAVLATANVWAAQVGGMMDNALLLSWDQDSKT